MEDRYKLAIDSNHSIRCWSWGWKQSDSEVWNKPRLCTKERALVKLLHTTTLQLNLYKKPQLLTDQCYYTCITEHKFSVINSLTDIHVYSIVTATSGVLQLHNRPIILCVNGCQRKYQFWTIFNKFVVCISTISFFRRQGMATETTHSLKLSGLKDIYNHPYLCKTWYWHT